MKENDAGFKRITDDSRNLVYAIYCANQNAEEGVPQQLEHALMCVKLHVLNFPLIHAHLVFFSMSRHLQNRSLLGPFSRLSYGLKQMQNRHNTFGRS